MTDKIALITGITGQDGAYLSELLLAKGYTVHGVKRRSSSFNTGRVDHLYEDPHGEDPRFVLHYGDMTDATNLIRLVQRIKPTEIYNLAAQSHVQVSFETAEYTANAGALVHLLKTYSDDSHLNVGTGEDLTILDLVHLISEVVGFKGSVDTDSTKPDGTPRKLLSIDRLQATGWSPQIPLRVGVESTYEWFLENAA